MRVTAAVTAVTILVLAACTPEGADNGTTTTTTAAPTTTTTAPTTTTTAPTTTTTVPPARFERATCRFDVPAGTEVECGWLEVPEDRADPASRTIRLHVAVFESENPDAPDDPVVYLEGGPGGDALETLPLVFEDRFAPLLADRHLVVFDQRGTGYSEPSLACPEVRELGFEIIDEELPDGEAARLQLGALSRCRDRLVSDGVSLDAYNSAASAADLADLRRALGIESWNLYGISYGTRLALTTMRDHPDGIRSVILDSAYPPDVDLVAEAVANFDRSLGELFGGCSADPGCDAAYPDLEERFFALVEALEERPLRAPVVDVFEGDTYDAVFDGSSIASIVFQSLYLADVIPRLPRLIDDVAAGDTSELTTLASSYLANGEFVSTGMHFSVQCNEEVVFSSPDRVDEAIADHPRLEPFVEDGTNLGPSVFEVCASWGAGEADSIENEPVRSPIPTLVMAGQFDPITPPSWGRRTADALSAATFVEFPGLGHGSSTEGPCPRTILEAFLDDPDTPPDTSCAESLGPPTFVTGDVVLPDLELVPFAERFGAVELRGLVPDGWERQALGVWTRGLDGFDVTTLVQQFGVGADEGTILGIVAGQFGLGNVSEPDDTHRTELGVWSLHDGNVVGAPATVAVLQLGSGSVLVALIGSPSEWDELRSQLLFRLLDAIEVG